MGNFYAEMLNRTCVRCEGEMDCKRIRDGVVFFLLDAGTLSERELAMQLHRKSIVLFSYTGEHARFFKNVLFFGCV